MTEENKTEAEEIGVDCCGDRREAGPCDVWPPRPGPCGGGRQWMYNPVRQQWECR